MRFFCCLAYLWIFYSQASALTLISTSQEGNSLKYDFSNKQIPGVCNEIIKMVEQRTHLIFTGLEMQRKTPKIVHDIAAKKLDVYFCLIKTDERQKYVEFIEPVLFHEQAVFGVRADDSISISNWNELRATPNNTILAVHGTAYVGSLQQVSDVKIDDGAPTLKDGIKKLLNNRGRFIVSSKQNLEVELKNSKLTDKVRILPWVWRTEGQYLVVRKDLSPDLKILLSQALADIRKTKKYRKLMKKYSLNP